MLLELLARAPGAGVAESPVWDERNGSLLWVVAGRAVLSTTLGDGPPVTSIVGRSLATAVALTDRRGVLAVVLADGRVELHGAGPERAVARVELRAGESLNDAGVSPDGGLWFGSGGDLGGPSRGRLFSAGRSGLRCLLDPIGLSNGIGWSPDGSVLHWVDTAAGRVSGFTGWRSGVLRRDGAIDLPRSEGLPDGIAVDALGRLWIALWGGAAVQCRTPGGELLASVELPRRLVTSCCFAGPRLGDLAITTAGDAAGAHVPELWVARDVGATGLATARMQTW